MSKSENKRTYPVHLEEDYDIAIELIAPILGLNKKEVVCKALDSFPDFASHLRKARKVIEDRAT